MKSSNDKLRSKIDELIKKYGPWTAHNIQLSSNVYTIGENITDRSSQRASVYMNIWETLKNKKVRGMKVLDLGCLEGGISLRLAEKGAKVVGVDVRDGHLKKASFSAEYLGLKRRCNWIQGDVTESNLWNNLGIFDIIICSGLLYHLNEIDIPLFMRNIFNACRNNGIVIIDTNISPEPRESIVIPGHPKLYGCRYREHADSLSDEQRLSSGWSSYRNNTSFWLTERSLVNTVIHAGFSSVIKPLYPYHEWNHKSRNIWVATKANNNRFGLSLLKEPDLRPLWHPGLK